MYQIIGADGQKYGPVSAAQIRAWVTENRIRAETLIQAEGSTDWKPLSSFPEFADLFGAATGTPPPFAPPPIATPPPNPDALVAEVLARHPQIDIGACVSRGWNLVMSNFWLSVGVGFVCLLVANVPFLYGPAYAGLFWFFLKRIRGQQVKFEDAFAPFSVALLQTFLAGLVTMALASVGFMLCILPGLVLMAVWMFTWPLLMDKRLEFWPAMEVSRRVLWPNIGGALGLWVVSLLITLAGALACYVGLFVAFPVIIAAQAYAYEDFFGRKQTLS
ncbi:MAG: GYF domain-containing protein [Verrucomicrobiota bacterium]